MKMLLLPKNIKTLKEFHEWVDRKLEYGQFVIGVRRECKISKIAELGLEGRWREYNGVKLFYNF